VNKTKKKVKVLTPKQALKKAKVSNKLKHHTIYNGDLPISEITINQFNQRKYFSDVTKSFYKMGAVKPEDVKVRVMSNKINFTTPSFETTKKNYIQSILFPKKLTEIKDRKQMKNLDVKLDCSCPSFSKQGMMYKLGTIESAIKRETRSDDRWGPRHSNKNYLCKHLKYVIKNFEAIMKKV